MDRTTYVPSKTWQPIRQFRPQTAVQLRGFLPDSGLCFCRWEFPACWRQQLNLGTSCQDNPQLHPSLVEQYAS